MCDIQPETNARVEWQNLTTAETDPEIGLAERSQAFFFKIMGKIYLEKAKTQSVGLHLELKSRIPGLIRSS